MLWSYLVAGGRERGRMWANTDRHCQQNMPFVQLARQYGRMLAHGQAPRTPYVERMPGEYRSICHQGQRKLLMSEIELLVQASAASGSANKGGELLVVYAGAAPGLHIPFLAEMFPRCRFHLYDPARFGIEESDRIRIFNRVFTNEDACGYAVGGQEKNTVLISDIRTRIDERSVWEDMQTQRGWHERMLPVMTSLKFRLPWDMPRGATVEYLDGDVYLPVWGRTSTTECRLFVDRARHGASAHYQPRAYEEEMSHFNREIRPAVHLHTARDARFDRCYDCASEVWILRQYLRAFHARPGKETVVTLAEAISASLKQMRGRALQCEEGAMWMSVFWKDCSQDRFQALLLEANRSYPGAPGCQCIGCGSGKEERCRFRAWFVERVEAYGMSVRVATPADSPVVRTHECCPDSFVLDVDSHFTVQEGGFDWTPVRYGARIWKALGKRDPELGKLSSFWHELMRGTGAYLNAKDEAMAETDPPAERLVETCSSTST